MTSGDLSTDAGDWAREMTETIQGVFAGTEGVRFEAVVSPTGNAEATRVTVHSEPRAIPLSISGRPTLELAIKFECRWDHKGRYLAVDRSTWAVRYAGEPVPLLRVEFESRMRQTDVPAAHFHVHAHRDEFMYALMQGAIGRPTSRVKALLGESKASPPRLSDVHFPLGGPRMRPCLEDLFTLLVGEFRVDTVTGWNDILVAGRIRWRKRQISAAVRDAPEEAARVLVDECGYSVTPPEAGHAPDNREKLARY